MAAVDILKISFEFSPKQGIRELPDLNADYESNVKGLFVVGDLADAPIIKVALNQGYDVARKVVENLGATGSPGDDVHDVIVIGAGPAGIGAAIGCKDAGANYLFLEKERPFNTIQNFPKAKFVFSEPREMENRGNFWFEDAQKEDLIDRWEEEIDQRGLKLQQPEEVVDVQKDGGIFTVTTKVGEGGLTADSAEVPHAAEAGAQNVYKAKRIVLAIGRRGSVTRMRVPGEDHEKVHYTLKDPDLTKGKRLAIFGGGDSAVEAACSCADAGAQVTICYRKDAFDRAKLGNQARIKKLIDAGKITFLKNASPVEIKPESVVVKVGDEVQEFPNDEVLVFFGTKLPKPFLEKIGLNFAGQMTLKRFAFISSFATVTYLFYLLKTKKKFFPFVDMDLMPGSGELMLYGAQVHKLLEVNLGFREVNGSFWGTVCYAVIVTAFGIRAYRKYPLRTQKLRYVSLIVFQLVFLFGIPEILAPLMIDRGYKMYSLSVPWPLSVWSVVDAPGWVPGGPNTGIALGWIGLGLVTSFILVPLFVRFHGERFCSYMCGCGGLAETLGDFWRDLAPRGKTSYQAEWIGKIILVAAVPVTLYLVANAWGFLTSGALYDTGKFAAGWYDLVVDFWLACVIGVAFYPYLGNRVWCRFFCPLRAYMELLSKWFSKIAIDANDKCIGCGECTRYCQMGIVVQSFAQKQQQFHNGNSACIQCGICVQVCPMEVLSIGERGVSISKKAVA